jgi:hypothetical protein
LHQHSNHHQEWLLSRETLLSTFQLHQTHQRIETRVDYSGQQFGYSEPESGVP